MAISYENEMTHKVTVSDITKWRGAWCEKSCHALAVCFF